MAVERHLHNLNLYDNYAAVIHDYVKPGNADKIPVDELNKPSSEPVTSSCCPQGLHRNTNSSGILRVNKNLKWCFLK